MVDTFLLNEEDGDVLGLAGGIVKAIVGGPEQSRCLPVLYGEMLGRKWVLGNWEGHKKENGNVIKSLIFGRITLITIDFSCKMALL